MARYAIPTARAFVVWAGRTLAQETLREMSKPRPMPPFLQLHDPIQMRADTRAQQSRLVRMMVREVLDEEVIIT